jgi:hypothetical protein
MIDLVADSQSLIVIHADLFRHAWPPTARAHETDQALGFIATNDQDEIDSPSSVSTCVRADEVGGNGITAGPPKSVALSLLEASDEPAFRAS